MLCLVVLPYMSACSRHAYCVSARQLQQHCRLRALSHAVTAWPDVNPKATPVVATDLPHALAGKPAPLRQHQHHAAMKRRQPAVTIAAFCHACHPPPSTSILVRFLYSRPENSDPNSPPNVSPRSRLQPQTTSTSPSTAKQSGGKSATTLSQVRNANPS